MALNSPPSGARSSSRGSPRDAKTRLKKVRILIGDPDERVSSLIYNVLRSFGFDQIDVVKDGQQMLHVLLNKDVDLMVSEWDLQGMDGIRLIQLIRSESNQRWQRDLPAIILTGKADLESVRKARDAGYTEFVAKPFSAKSVSTRLLQMIDNPRPFVVSPVFNGPCRRRRTIPDFDGTLERRGKQQAADKPAVIMSEAEQVTVAQGHAMATMTDVERTAYTKATASMTEQQRLEYIKSDGAVSDAERSARNKVKVSFTEIQVRENKKKEAPKLVEILPPNKRLIQMIGDDVKGSDLFTEKVISGAQEEIKKKESEFLAWADDDIRILESSYKKLKDDHHDEEAKTKLLAAAYSLKSQAGIFGYDMGTEVSRMLLDYMPADKAVNEHSLIVLRKFLDTISVVFRLKVKEAGGDIGAALIKGLQILTKKLG